MAWVNGSLMRLGSHPVAATGAELGFGWRRASAFRAINRRWSSSGLFATARFTTRAMRHAARA